MQLLSEVNFYTIGAITSGGLMRSLTLMLVALVCATPVAVTKDKKKVPHAPLPAQIIAAKKVFLLNSGGGDLAFDAFYGAIKSWSKYAIVESRDQAELVFVLSSATIDRGTHVWSSTNTYTGATQVHSAQVTDPQLYLSIIDPKTEQLLWSTMEHRQLARLERNIEKETIKAAEKLVRNLRERVEEPTDSAK